MVPLLQTSIITYHHCVAFGGVLENTDDMP